MNKEYRSLVTLHLRVNLLADIYTTAGYAHSRGGPSMLQNLTSTESPDFLVDLGTLHRSFVWETMVLKTALDEKGAEKSRSVTPTGDELLSLNHPPEPFQAPTPATATATATASAPKSDTKVSNSARDHNAKVLRHLATAIPSALAPFFQGMLRVAAI